MKTLTGKSINDYAVSNNNLPDYWGDTYTENNDYWSDRRNPKRVKGEFIAKKYKAIIEVIQQTKSVVRIENDCIYIEYANGSAKIDRDILTDTFLLPYLNTQLQ